MAVTADPLVFEACLKSIRQSLEQANVSSKPFPYFLFRNIFPSDVYEQMLATRPPLENYRELEKYAGTTGQTRHRCSLTMEGLSGMSAADQAFWQAVRDAIGHPEVKRAVFRLLAEGLVYRYGVPAANVDSIPAFPKSELYHEISGYSIKPHPDTRKKVVTMQIALPHDESQRDLGTEFYRLNPLSLFSKPYAFSKICTTPFLPNSGYAFVVLNTKLKRSWHGRSELSGECGERNSLLHLYYENPAEADPEVFEKFYTTPPQVRAAA